jgi:hypothetical protein
MFVVVDLSAVVTAEHDVHDLVGLYETVDEALEAM